jgi:DNA-binding transcriptional ArsR family regulator
VSQHVLTLLSIILAGGALGGIVSAFLSEDSETTVFYCFKQIVVGIGCAFIVPLFLNMISSTLLQQAQNDPVAYFVFAGFCVIAAASSKRFISSVSARVLQQVKEAKGEAKKATELAEASIESQAEPEELRGGARDSIADVRLVSDPGSKILQALANSKYTMRTVGGIRKDSGLDQQTVADHLRKLEEAGAVAKVARPGKADLWHLAPLGKAKFEDVGRPGSS